MNSFTEKKCLTKRNEREIIMIETNFKEKNIFNE